MERRVLLAVFLSFLVLVLYQRWLGPVGEPIDLANADPAGMVEALGGTDDAPVAIGAVTAPGIVTPTVVEAPQPSVAPPPFEPVVADSEKSSSRVSSCERCLATVARRW